MKEGIRCWVSILRIFTHIPAINASVVTGIPPISQCLFRAGSDLNALCQEDKGVAPGIAALRIAHVVEAHDGFEIQAEFILVIFCERCSRIVQAVTPPGGEVANVGNCGSPPASFNQSLARCG
ncbi:hypothetical protein [Marinobacterium aestuarii]|uniref:hypothetical protein n=1 Tax=Marinobacterium aestuarii TaxID=1821621 RepID=UPI0012FF6702|nr:hypothetical protein [Marinobacterium aestuarii]